jgi:rhodanese-related sulfurtransferase
VSRIAFSSNAEVQALLSAGALYLDVRTPLEFEAGHVAGAYNLPLSFGTLAGLTPNPDFSRSALEQLDPARVWVVGCHSGARAARAALALEEAGFSQLHVHREGWGGCRDAFGRLTPGWSQAGLPHAQGGPAEPVAPGTRDAAS